MPNNTSKLSLALAKVGLPLQIRTHFGRVTVHPSDEDGNYPVTGLGADDRAFPTIESALIACAGLLAALRPKATLADPFDD